MAEQKPQNRKITGQRDAKGRFIKGNNSNPGGRLKQDEAMNLLRSFAPDAVRTAVEMLKNNLSVSGYCCAAVREAVAEPDLLSQG